MVFLSPEIAINKQMKSPKGDIILSIFNEGFINRYVKLMIESLNVCLV